MRLCLVTETYPPEINGVALTIERVVQHLRAEGHALSLIRPRQRDEAPRHEAGEWRTAGAPIPMYPSLRFGWSRVDTLRRHYRRHAPDLVHVATPGPLGRAAVLAAAAEGLPVTTDFRTNFHWYARYYHCGWLEPVLARYLRGLHNRATATFVPTRSVRQQLATQGFQRLEVLGRGVDTQRFHPARRSAALRAGWCVAQDHTPVALYVGRLAAEKNLALALEAYEALRTQQPAARLVIVGDGPLAGWVRRRCPDAVCTGALRGDALAAHYASADLLLFPSESDTFGNVTLEGLASGLVVVAYELAAAAEHLHSGRDGCLVTPGDRAAYVRAVCAAGQAAPEAVAAMRRAARAQAESLTWEAVLGRFTHRLAQHAARSPAEALRDVALA